LSSMQVCCPWIAYSQGPSGLFCTYSPLLL
jgi:hypothetical protein